MFRSLVSPLPKTTNKLLPVPILIFFTTDDGQCRMIDPSRDDDSYYCNHLQLPEYPFTVHFCKDGWIVIHDRQLDFPLDEDLKISDLKSIGFSANPTSSDCVTVVFDHDYDVGSYIMSNTGIRNGRTVGAFYVLGIDGRLGEFKVLGDGQKIECNGDLLAVFIGRMGTWVEVYKFNLSERKWIKVKSLGNYSLFVSNSSSFSIQPTEAWMRNRIYVPRIKGNRIVSTHLILASFMCLGLKMIL
ncbi:hypothetical protein RDABS01_032905 [Bienertia sinuspersici]